jgi:transcriptional regulator GlxA family with amidase domain
LPAGLRSLSLVPDTSKCVSGWGAFMEPRVHKAIRLMTKDLSRDVSPVELSLALNLSISRLRHLFKVSTGTSPARYLKARRIERAKELLETTFLNVKQVMLKTGFKHRSHFLSAFKKAYGLSPSQYRIRFLLDKQQQREDPQ